jgi:hypothetical protein
MIPNCRIGNFGSTF